MKLQEFVPIAFAAAAAAVALALDEPVHETLSSNEAVVSPGEAEAAAPPAAVPEAEAAPAPAHEDRRRPATTAPKRAVGVRKVEARNSVVQLSGWTMTAGQSLRAQKAAARVKGVRSVVNEIRPRVGAITS